jgi:uncharacterized membrane protein YdbT with pleckstrin-like domain
MDGYQKMCVTNKNVINMGMIIKGVYYILMCLSYKIIKYVFINYRVNNHNKKNCILFLVKCQIGC